MTAEILQYSDGRIASLSERIQANARELERQRYVLDTEVILRSLDWVISAVKLRNLPLVLGAKKTILEMLWRGPNVS